jgi:hypothetical protein
MLNDTLKNASLPPAEPTSLELFGKALDLLADPATTKAVIKDLLEAAEKARAATETMRAESAAMDTKRQSHLALFTDERAAHETKLREDRAAFDAECTRRTTALNEAEQKAAAAQASADNARQHAVTLSNDLESRLQILHSAATAPLPARH